MSGSTNILVAVLSSCAVAYVSFKLGARSAFFGDVTPAATGRIALDVDRDGGFEPRLRGGNPPCPPEGTPPPEGTQPPVDEELPSCARDVFVVLHKKLGGEDERSCRGLLVSDDLLVTSRACSAFEFTFDFPGFGVACAAPHDVLNAREEMGESRLGFLRAAPPQDSHLLGRQVMGRMVRRTPLFLSRRSTSGDGQSDGSDEVRGDGSDEVGTRTVVDCVDKHIPVARNFPVDGELVPLGELDGVVPDEILWEDADLETAVALKWKTNRWWTRPVTLEDEEAEIRRMIELYRGPPGSVSIPVAHGNKFVSTAGGLFEAVDPRGHRKGDCFKNYFVRYLKETPFSGLRFFDWLDFGPGKHVLRTNKTTEEEYKKDLSCLREDWNYKVVHYFDDQERREHEIYIAPSGDGSALVARYRHNDQPVPESDPDDPHLYVWDLNGTFYVVDEDSWEAQKYGGHLKHTSVLAGRPALSAGKAYFGKGGAIGGFDYASGHYRPKLHAAALMYRWMEERGFDTSAVRWIGRTSWATKSCDETEWDAIDIPGYDRGELERACREVKASPTWMTKEDVRR